MAVAVALHPQMAPAQWAAGPHRPLVVAMPYRRVVAPQTAIPRTLPPAASSPSSGREAFIDRLCRSVGEENVWKQGPPADDVDSSAFSMQRGAAAVLSSVIPSVPATRLPKRCGYPGSGVGSSTGTPASGSALMAPSSPASPAASPLSDATRAMSPPASSAGASVASGISASSGAFCRSLHEKEVRLIEDLMQPMALEDLRAMTAFEFDTTLGLRGQIPGLRDRITYIDAMTVVRQVVYAYGLPGPDDRFLRRLVNDAAAPAPAPTEGSFRRRPRGLATLRIEEVHATVKALLLQGGVAGG